MTHANAPLTRGAGVVPVDNSWTRSVSPRRGAVSVLASDSEVGGWVSAGLPLTDRTRSR